MFNERLNGRLNGTRFLFIEVKHILIEIKEKCPYPINHQDIENYQQEVRHLLKLKNITNKPDVYACQIALHVNVNEFTTWQEINDFYSTDYEQNKIHFYPLMYSVAKCACGQDCTHRFRFIFNQHYVHVGCVCIDKDEIVCRRFKQYKIKVKRIYTLLVSYYKYVLYSTFKRFKFYKSQTILIKYRNKSNHKPIYIAFQKWKSKPIEVKPIEVKPIEVKPIEVKPIEVKPIIEVKSIIEVKPIEVKPIMPIVTLIPKRCIVCSKPSGKYPRCVSCEIEYKKLNKDTCRCGKYKDKKYKICYACKIVLDATGQV